MSIETNIDLTLRIIILGLLYNLVRVLKKLAKKMNFQIIDNLEFI